MEMITENIQRIIAYVLKRSGKTSITKSDFYLTLSMDLQWCSPQKAKIFVDQLITNGFINEKQNELYPTFDYKNVIIPMGFHPDESEFNEEIIKDKKNLKDLINSLINKTQKNIDEINKEIEKISSEKNIDYDVALLLYSKKHDIPITDFILVVEQKMFKENIE